MSVGSHCRAQREATHIVEGCRSSLSKVTVTYDSVRGCIVLDLIALLLNIADTRIALVLSQGDEAQRMLVGT